MVTVIVNDTDTDGQAHDLTIELTLPELPTHQLLAALAQGAWWQLIPGAVAVDELQPLALRFQDDSDEFDFEGFYDIATALFGRLAGTAPTGGGSGWWPAVRLAATAVTAWPAYVAWCAAHGADPVGGPGGSLWRTLGSVYAWLRDRAGPEGHDKLDQHLWAPPPQRASAGVAGDMKTEELPQHVRDEEAALALAALRDTLPGEERVTEWTG